MYCVFGSFGGIMLSSRMMVRMVVMVLTAAKAASPILARSTRSSRENDQRASFQPILALFGGNICYFMLFLNVLFAQNVLAQENVDGLSWLGSPMFQVSLMNH
jgi:hypothetical protein